MIVRIRAAGLVGQTLFLAWLLALGPAAAASTVWNEPERITHNTIEDRTTSGSLIHPCLDEAYAVWMQEQDTPGWRLMWSMRSTSGWSEPEPIDPGDHPDFEPRVGLETDLRAVWQRDSGGAAEIVFAERPFGGPWTVETVTTNATEDVTPDLPPYADFGEPRHVVWVGFDPLTQTGRIFHAVSDGGGWQIERLAGTQLGVAWRDAAPRIDVDDNPEVVHIVYRAGLFADYHLNYARKEGGTWTYRVLTSVNEIDLSVDVQGRGGGPVVVAMSGTDQNDSPPRIYLRRSNNGGLSFDPPELVSTGFSASLGNLVAGVLGVAVSGSEVSGANIDTGNLLYAIDGRGPEILPPADMASGRPCAGQSGCIPGVGGAGFESVLYVNHGGAGSDSAEVYFLTTPGSTSIMDGGHPLPASAMELGVRVAPNPFSAATTIEVTGPAPLDVSIYDVSGHLVRRLAAGSMHSAVPAAFVWDGRTGEGQRAPAGVYLLRIEWADRGASARIMRVR